MSAVLAVTNLSTSSQVSSQMQIEKTKYAGTAAKLLNLIAAGVTQSQAAKALGVSEGLVSQYMAEQDFRDQIQEKLNSAASDAIEIDKNYIDIEKIVSKRLAAQAQMVTNVDQLMRLAKFSNEAKKKVQATPLNSETQVVMRPVTLVLPTILVKNIIVDPTNQILAIDGRNLVTLGSDSMPDLAKRNRAANLEETIIDVTPDKEIQKVKQNGTRNVDPWADL